MSGVAPVEYSGSLAKLQIPVKVYPKLFLSIYLYNIYNLYINCVKFNYVLVSGKARKAWQRGL